MDVSPCNGYMVTGAYNRSAHVVDINGTFNTALPCNFDSRRGKAAGSTKKYNPNKKLPPGDSAGETVDFKKKVMSGCWSPRENICALAFRNCIFLYGDKVK